jgi:hypothetical protein
MFGDFLLIKPRTFLTLDNRRTFKFVLSKFPGSSMDDCTVVFPDITIPVGTFQTGFANRASYVINFYQI